jgi:hypothetical protein
MNTDVQSPKSLASSFCQNFGKTAQDIPPASKSLSVSIRCCDGIFPAYGTLGRGVQGWDCRETVTGVKPSALAVNLSSPASFVD